MNKEIIERLAINKAAIESGYKKDITKNLNFANGYALGLKDAGIMKSEEAIDYIKELHSCAHKAIFKGHY